MSIRIFVLPKGVAYQYDDEQLTELSIDQAKSFQQWQRFGGNPPHWLKTQKLEWRRA